MKFLEAIGFILHSESLSEYIEEQFSVETLQVLNRVSHLLISGSHFCSRTVYAYVHVSEKPYFYKHTKQRPGDQGESIIVAAYNEYHHFLSKLAFYHKFPTVQIP